MNRKTSKNTEINSIGDNNRIINIDNKNHRL